MTAKYQRVRQADEALPAPMRWLTRAFSSITMSVVLLGLIALVAGLRRVPVDLPWDASARWPMQVLLLLLAVNVVWAAVRRVALRLANLGVFAVLVGLASIALGVMVYDRFKVDGDMLVIRSDLPGGQPVSQFYDRHKPALFVSVDRAPAVQLPLPTLPRYHDAEFGQLDIDLTQTPGFADRFGDELRMSIPGLILDGALEHVWAEAPDGEADASLGPAVTVAMGSQDTIGQGPRLTLPAARPAERVIHHDVWDLEYLHRPSAQRVADLLTEAPPQAMDAPHLLLIEVGSDGYREVRAVKPGDTFDVGDTGYHIAVEDIGPYGLPFVTEGYRGATDTHARLSITGRKAIERYALARYPERSQDFVDGQRGDPDPDIRTVFLDQSKVQYYLFSDPPALPKSTDATAESSADQADAWGGLWILLRIAGMEPVLRPLVEDKLPIPGMGSDQMGWLHVIDRLEHAALTTQPVVTPDAERRPREHGTYERAILPVALEYALHDEHLKPTGEVFRQTIYVPFTAFPEPIDDRVPPQRVSIPGYGTVEFTFSRQRYNLPFAVQLSGMTVNTYEGSSVPRDIASDLLIYPVNDLGRPVGSPTPRHADLDTPVLYEADHAPPPLARIKLTQAGWDPGDTQAAPELRQATDAEGRFINQHRFTILDVSNSPGTAALVGGTVLVCLGLVWMLYVMPRMRDDTTSLFAPATSKPDAASRGTEANASAASQPTEPAQPVSGSPSR